MRTIAIVPVNSGADDPQFTAYSGNLHSVGKTAGAALDALSYQLSDAERTTWVIVQHFRPDEFFKADQCHRLQELMERRRAAHDAGGNLTGAEQHELEALVKSELEAAAARSAAIVCAKSR